MDTNSHHAGNGGPPSPKRRRKIPLACEACRNRKSRCDGVRPNCSACRKKGTLETCVYEESTLKTQRIAVLENRVRELESKKVENKSRPADNTPVMARRDGSVSASTGSLSLLEISETPQTTRYNPVTMPYGAVPFEANTSTSGDTHPRNVFTASAAVDEDEDPSHASTNSFIRSLRAVILPSDVVTPTPPELNAVSNGAHQNTAASSSSDILPSITREQADSYTSYFFRNYQSMFPILHRPTFEDSYQAMWKSDSQIDNCFLSAQDPLFTSTLCIVLAIGCQFTSALGRERKTKVAEDLYQEARKVFALDELDSLSLQIVQLLLLTGLTIRNAQSLGLHEVGPKDSQTQLEREMSRRVWYSCVIFDRVVGVTFGRPHMISSFSLPLPLLVDDEFLLSNGEGQQPEDTISYLGLFVSSITLYEIMADVLAMSSAYRELRLRETQKSRPWWDFHSLDRILEINKALEEFELSLPTHLRAPQSYDEAIKNSQRMAWIQAKILHCRILFTRALLLRPLLISAAQHRGDNTRKFPHAKSPPLGYRVAVQVCLACVDTVDELVDAVDSSLYVDYISSAWITNYIFPCAMCLVAARMCSLPELQQKSACLESLSVRCITILNHYRGQIPSATHAAKLLDSLQGHGISKSRSPGHNYHPNKIASAAMTYGNDDTNLEDLSWFSALPDDFAYFDLLNMGSFYDTINHGATPLGYD